MKIQFDATLDFQRQAVEAVVDVFDGQPIASGNFDVRLEGADRGPQVSAFGSVTAIANDLKLGADQLAENVARVRERNNLRGPVDPPGRLATTPSMWGEADPRGGIPHFSVDMETGTGKTYVYLRTIFALHQKYGFRKFVIVVPSVAIREGVTKSIELTREHFHALFENTPFDAWVYDSTQVSRLRQFAASSHIQVLVINIQAFDKPDIAVIHKETDRLPGGFKPIQFIQAARPIVIVDEPQNMESENAQKSIASLNPLCTLRYSATHRNPYNLLYRLGPVAAYQQRLVKHIEVDAVLDAPDFNKPYILVEWVRVKPTLAARVTIDVQGQDGPARKSVTLKKKGVDLYDISNGRDAYKGYIVSEINARDPGHISFANGVRLYGGASQGGRTDEVMRVQVRQTIRWHFDKELAVRRFVPERRIKVLSLFFIDRVANYADEGGKIRQWFIEEYHDLAKDPAFADLKLLPAEQVHNGYFAADKAGKAKDTTGGTQADDDAYSLIMRDKERLLSPDEPLRFIFSHSALREGWDNPNVFQICTLNESRSRTKKRQEIGRGLRLPVLDNGERCHDDRVNKLTVIANESYDEFCRGLQTEMEEECGEGFETPPPRKRDRRKLAPTDGWRSEDFKELWRRISVQTRYSVEFSTAALIQAAVKAIQELPPITAPKIVTQLAQIEMDESGLHSAVLSVSEAGADYHAGPVPDMLAYLQRETLLTRATLAEVLIQSGRLDDAPANPQQFLDAVTACLRDTLHGFMVDGVKYEAITTEDGTPVRYEMALFEENEIQTYLDRLVTVGRDRTVFDAVDEATGEVTEGVVEYESEVERQFAEAMRVRRDVKLFVKLPWWFKVPTPIGTYNPDWALLLNGDAKVYLVRETKSTHDMKLLRPAEKTKIECGGRHFESIGVDYAVVTSAAEVLAHTT